MTPEELAVAHHADALAFTLTQWRKIQHRLPAWMRDEWSGVAGEALWEAARGYREEGFAFKTFLFAVCSRAVWDTLAWARRKKRRPQAEVGPLVGEVVAPQSADPYPVNDLMYSVWSAAMSEDPQGVYDRFVRDTTLSDARRSSVNRLIKRLRGDFHKRYEDSL